MKEPWARWALPPLMILGGPGTILAALILSANRTSTPLVLSLLALGVLISTSGLASLIARVRARFTDDRVRELRLDVIGDIATFAGLACVFLCVVVVFGHRLGFDLGRSHVIEGTLSDMRFQSSRGADDLTVRLFADPRPYRWSCGWDCRWAELEAVAEKGEAPVRLVVLGDRIIGFQAHGRIILRPNRERLRWTLADAFYGFVGGLLTLGFGFAAHRQTRNLHGTW